MTFTTEQICREHPKPGEVWVDNQGNAFKIEHVYARPYGEQRGTSRAHVVFSYMLEILGPPKVGGRDVIRTELAGNTASCGGMRIRCTVVDIRHEKYDTYIGRAGDGESGYFGNPFKLKNEVQRTEILEKYKIYFYQRLDRDKFFKARVLELRGQRLGCFCHPLACHGHVIAEYVNQHFGDA